MVAVGATFNPLQWGCQIAALDFNLMVSKMLRIIPPGMTIPPAQGIRIFPDRFRATCKLRRRYPLMILASGFNFRCRIKNRLYKPPQTPNFRAPPLRRRYESNRFSTMRVLSSLASAKRRHADCQVVSRKGTNYVICKTNPKFKARQGATKGTRLSKKGVK